MNLPADRERREVEGRLQSRFATEAVLRTLGATLTNVSPGMVEIRLRSNRALSNHHGVLHFGALSAVADAAASYAALSVLPPGRGVLTTEFTIDVLAPALGGAILARGRVLTAGATLTVAQSEVFATAGSGHHQLIALLTATLISVDRRAASAN